MSLLAPSSSHLRSSRGEHELLPSLPPSPTPSATEEEDLANGSSAAWRGARDEDRLMVRTDAKGKGKGKAREVVDLNQDDDGADSYGTLTPVRESSEGGGSYPPTNEEEEEAKRIEENLRRWEQAERQRRKSAREKALGAPAASSVVGEVSRRASLLWPGKRASRASSKANGSLGSLGGGTHTVLHARNSEDAVAMNDLDARSAPSPGSSKPNSPVPPSSLSIAENPFEPPDSATPLRGFDESVRGSGSAVMNPSSSPPPPTPSTLDLGESPFDDSMSVTPTAVKRPTLQVGSVSHSAPPPRPINIPPPKTPPPRVVTPGMTSPPGLTPNPSLTSSGIDMEDSNESHWKKRWWTDWLCGCREGADRGGDDQAGRTNPFE